MTTLAPPRRRPEPNFTEVAASDPAHGRNFTEVAPLVWSAVGVLGVALAYAAGRSGIAGGSVLYWVGQALVFIPVALRVLSRRLTGGREAVLLVLGLALNQYLLKWAYSPDQFRFADELQHWAATNNLLTAGQLFQPNHALPVSAYFPGLEEMGGALAAMTGLPVTAAGMVVAGVLHLLFVAVLFMLVRRTGGSYRLAALSCLVYATGLHYLFFDSMYGYQTAALPFLLLAVWAARALRPGGWPVLLVGVISILVTTVTHHVSALVLVASLALLAVAECALRGRRRVGTVALAGTAALALAAWFWFVAREVLAYLAMPVHGMMAALTRLVTGGEPASASSTGGSPLWALAIQAASLLVLFVLFTIAGWRAVRHRPRPRSPWRWYLLLGALAFFGGSSLRFLGSQGPELAGRAATFTFLPMSIVAARVLLPRLRVPRHCAPPARLTGRPVPAGLLVLSLLLVAARVGGWPPAWELLPGRYLVSGYERGVDPTGVAAATWTRRTLGTGNRIAADVNGYTLVSTYGGQDPVGEASALYDDFEWGLSDEQVLQDFAVSFLWVDARTGEQVPASGALFPTDSRAGQRTAPLSSTQLSKVDQLSAADRRYDNGTIRIYDMRQA